MSDDLKARAQQLLDSITPAPWVWQTNDKGYPQQIVANDDGLVLVAETYTGPEHPAAEAEFIAAAPELVRELLAALETAEASRDLLRRKHLAFTGHLGYGDGVTEPAAELDELVDRIETAFATERDHTECPVICELCGETLAATMCTRCYGSGCGPGTASGAYEECQWCAGVGRIHEGCAERSYADLVAELDESRAIIAESLKATNLAAAHRFDFDRRLDSDHTEWLASLGEKPKRGPDNFYNGVQFVTRRVRRILASQS